jgi:arylsulfatase A-like enzyme
MVKKNVILICIDGGRLDRALNSKAFKHLATKSIFFPQTITYAPYTNSAIHALISGTYGNRNGCSSYWHSIKFKKFEFKTLTEYLHDVGYYTYADIPSDLVLPNSGFDEFEVFDESLVDLKKRHSNLIEKMKAKNEDNQSFFLYLHYESIHTGILNSVLKAYDNHSEEYFENRKLNEKRYDDLFRIAEEYIEVLGKKITDFDLWKDTIVLIISDHGISVGEKFGERAYGAFCYDYTIKTFAYYISSDFGSKEIPEQVRHIDFMPTILEQLNIGLDENFKPLDGVSLIPLINGESVDEKIAYTETANPLDANAPPKEPNTKSVRTSKWKLIYNEHNNTKELYNLEKDPTETNNLINSGLEIEEFLWNEFLRIQNSI